MTVRGQWVIFGLAFVLALAGSCSSGHSGRNGDNNGCPDGYLMGVDGKCHAIGGDSDPEADSEKIEAVETPDGDIDLSEKDDPADGDSDLDLIEQDEQPDADPDPDPEVLEKDEDLVDAEPEKIEAEEAFEYGEKGDDCKVDDDCGVGLYCSVTKKCTFNCTPETASGDCMGDLACCNGARGICVACGGDPDESDKVDLEHCATNNDCPLSDFCDTASGYCETDCGPSLPCPTGWTCKGTGPNNDHPQCKSTKR